MDIHLRVIEVFKWFLCEKNREGITFPKGEDGIEVCISFTPKGTAPATDPACTHPSAGRHKRTTSASSETEGQATRPEITTVRGIAAERGENYRDGCQGQKQQSQVGIGERHWVVERQIWVAGGDNRQRGGNGGDRGGNRNTPNPTHIQDVQWCR